MSFIVRLMMRNIAASLTLIAFGGILRWGVTYKSKTFDIKNIGLVILLAALVYFLIALVMYIRSYLDEHPRPEKTEQGKESQVDDYAPVTYEPAPVAPSIPASYPSYQGTVDDYEPTQIMPDSSYRPRR